MDLLQRHRSQKLNRRGPPSGVPGFPLIRGMLFSVSGLPNHRHFFASPGLREVCPGRRASRPDDPVQHLIPRDLKEVRAA